MSFQSRSPSPENDVFAISTTLIPERPPRQAGITSITFDNVLDSPLLLHEDLQPGCGGQLWPAGTVLAKYLLQRQSSTLLAGKTIVEIGAGVGLVGLAIASGLVQKTNNNLTVELPRIFITDQLPLLPLMERNITLNNLSDIVSAHIYDWGSPPTFMPNNRKYPDIILAADCVYFEPAFPLLLQTISDLLGSNTVCWFCFKKRRKADMRFIRNLKKRFSVLECDYHDEEKKKESIWLYKVTI